MELTEFVRRPFVVEAVEITDANLVEVAKIIGVLKVRDDGTLYIHTNRKIIPNIQRVDVGYWLTKMGEKYRVYSPTVFQKEFEELGQEWRAYFEQLQEQEDVS